MDAKKVGEQIAGLRKAKGLTQAERRGGVLGRFHL